MNQAENTTVSAVTSSGIAVTAVIFFRDAVLNMIPWLIASIPLILLDLDFGIKAARYRKERVKFSKAFRGTFGKLVEYVAWCCFAATASLAFGMKWIEWIVLGAVFINELSSIVGNYLETKGLELNTRNLWNAILKIFGRKTGIDTEDIDAGEIVKPKEQPRDPKTGRFTSKNAK